MSLPARPRILLLVALLMLTLPPLIAEAAPLDDLGIPGGSDTRIPWSPASESALREAMAAAEIPVRPDAQLAAAIAALPEEARAKADAGLLSLMTETLERMQMPAGTLIPYSETRQGAHLAQGGAPDLPAPHTAEAPIRVLASVEGDLDTEATGVRVLAHIGTTMALELPARALPALLGHPAVRKVQAERPYQPLNDLGRADARVDALVNSTGLTGRGTLVAILDSGIDWRHQDFRKADGSTRIVELLDLEIPGDQDGDGRDEGDATPVGGTIWDSADINHALSMSGRERWKRGGDVDGDGAADPILDNTTLRVPISFDPDDDVVVEHVWVHLGLEHQRLPDVHIELVAPNGDRATLLPAGAGSERGDELNAFYEVPYLSGRRLAGSWVLEIQDTALDGQGLFYGWTLIVNQPVLHTDTNGHGTHVAGTAAGDGIAGTGTGAQAGMAPEAGLLVGSGLQLSGSVDDLFMVTTVDMMPMLEWIDGVAERRREPVAVNISLGLHYGPHDGTRLEDRAIDDWLGPDRPGRVVAISAGNEGASEMHTSGEFRPGEEQVDLEVDEQTPGDEVSVWFEAGQQPTVSLSYPRQDQLSCTTFDPVTRSEAADCDALIGFGPGQVRLFRIFPPQEPDLTINDGRLIWPGAAGNNVQQGLYLDVNRRQMLLHYNKSPLLADYYAMLPGTWSLHLRGARGSWHAWSMYVGEWMEGRPFGERGDSRMTVGSPASAFEPIAVGAHVTRNQWLDESGAPTGAPVDVGVLAPFSSHGPTRDGRAKPDLTAPGAFVLSSASGTAGSHTVMAGTSMAAPMVTGALALLMQRFPDLTADEAKAALMAGARRDAFTGAEPEANLWGAGKLDLGAAMAELEGPPPPPQQAGIEVSSTIARPGWESEHLVDGAIETTWSSMPHGEHLQGAEWAVVHLVSPTRVDGVRIMPRPNLKDADHAEGFPKDFVIQYSFDGERRGRQLTCDTSDPRFAEAANWVPVATRTGYAQPGNRWQLFRFEAADIGCLRVFGTELSQDGFGNRYLQLAEIEPLDGETSLPTSSATTSSEVGRSGWETRHLIDGDPSTTWSSRPHDEHLAAAEWAVVRLPGRTTIDGVRIEPRVNDLDRNHADGFPKDFVIQYSFEGEHRGRRVTCDPNDPRFHEVSNWVPVITRFGYDQPRSVPQIFEFAPSDAGCLRILGTELSQDGFGNRYLQLAEIEPLYALQPQPRHDAVVDSTANGQRWSAAHLVDGRRETAWSSRAHAEHLVQAEWAALLLGGEQEVSGLRITPRQNESDPTHAEGFPKDFVIGYAVEGTARDRALTCNPADPRFYEARNWLPLVNRFGFPQPANAAQDFDFGSISAGCLRILATELSQDGFGNRYLQLAELQALRAAE